MSYILSTSLPLSVDSRERVQKLVQRALDRERYDREYFEALSEAAISGGTQMYMGEELPCNHVAEITAMERAHLYESIFAGRANKAFEQLTSEADNEDLGTWAERRAAAVAKIAARSTDTWEIYAQGKNYAERYGLRAPAPPASVCKTGPNIAACVRKLLSEKWWRSAGRIAHARRWEWKQHLKGRVHVGAQPCASDWAVKFCATRRADNHQMLLDLIAINEKGEEISVANVQQTSLANPELRRKELMARIRGLETIAEQRNDVGLMVTITLPSRFHRHTTKGGGCAPNPSYDRRSTPMDGQAELCEQWERVRARLSKAGVKFYGIRCSEPQHDGTPHWHSLIFVSGEQAGMLRRFIREEALAESPDEPGARRHRVRFVRVSASKGSATGYIAKYVSKNVDGYGMTTAATLGDDGQMLMAGMDAVSYSQRVTAWARVWGIRQFQMFGTPPATVYRELRRVRTVQLELPLIEPARAAADAGDFATFITHAGGICCPRRLQPLVVQRQDEPYSALTQFGQHKPHRIVGVSAWRQELPTRLHEWRIEFRPGTANPDAGDGTKISSPWTRVNNCNHPQASAAGTAPAASSQPAIEAPPPLQIIKQKE